MLCEYLKNLKKQQNLTNFQIATKSGVSESTVSRILKGDCKSVDYGTVLDIIIALGGSMDEAAGIKSASQAVMKDSQSFINDSHLAAIEARATQTFMRHIEDHVTVIHNERVNSLREIIAAKDKTIRMLLFALFFALAFLAGQWIVDALIGSSGWVRY